jgi:hypothetical protein
MYSHSLAETPLSQYLHIWFMYMGDDSTLWGYDLLMRWKPGYFSIQCVVSKGPGTEIYSVVHMSQSDWKYKYRC